MFGQETTQAELVIYPHLQPGERLLWSGRPRQGLCLRGAEWRSLLMSLVWAVVAAFFVTRLWRTGASATDYMAGAALLLYALYSTVGRVALAVWLRARTHYAVTDRRALIIQGRDAAAAQAVDLAPDALVTPEIRHDGSGSIRFGLAQTASGRRGRRRTLPPTFQDIPDAQRVYTLIQQGMQTRQTQDGR